MCARRKVLFLCTRNSCRSQMAEGWTRRFHDETIEAFSAGTTPGSLDPRAVRVMAEAGVDISGQRPKHLQELLAQAFDSVITVCARARESCPAFPSGIRKWHADFEDPPYLAEGAATEDAALAPYRRVRDEVRAFVAQLPQYLDDAGTTPRAF